MPDHTRPASQPATGDEPGVVPESAYTPPREHCPNPERWHAPDITATEVEVSQLVGMMAFALRPDVVVETGTYLGHTAQEIGFSLGGDARLYTVELDQDHARAAEERCVALPVTVVVGDSLEYHPPGLVDLFWLDSETDIRHLEIRHFLPWMHSRTVIGVHDTGPQHPVRGFLEPLVAEGIVEPPLWLPTPRGVAFMRVGDAGLRIGGEMRARR